MNTAGGAQAAAMVPTPAAAAAQSNSEAITGLDTNIFGPISQQTNNTFAQNNVVNEPAPQATFQAISVPV